MHKINLWQWTNGNLETICGTPFWKDADTIERWLQRAKLQYWRFDIPSTNIAGSFYAMICVWDRDYIKARKLLQFIKNKPQQKGYSIPLWLQQFMTAGYWKPGHRDPVWIDAQPTLF